MCIRDSNDGVFYFLKSVENDHSWFDASGDSPTTQTINFYNDGLYPVIDPTDDIKLFDISKILSFFN